MVIQKVVCSLLLSDPIAASSIHPTPMATFCRVPCGVALLPVPTLYDDPKLSIVVTLQAVPSEIHLCSHPKLPAPPWDTVPGFGHH